MAPVWTQALEAVDKGWYSRLNPRWMDLVGDFAGSEAFVIDGDSLCRFVLDDPLLALGKTSDLSFQLVHALWALEKLVQDFVSRRCNFGIVFFEVNRHLVLASSGDSTQFVVQSRKLARTVFKPHLTQLKGISVSTFTSLDDSKWALYKQAVKPICVLYSDGSFLSGQGSSGLLILSALAHRKFVHDVLASGIAIVSLDSADFRGSKIISFVYEQRRSTASQEGLLKIWRIVNKVAAALDGQLEPLDAMTPGPSSFKSQQEWVQVAVPLFLQVTPVSANKDALLYLFIVHLILLPSLALADRAQGLPMLHPALQEIMSKDFLPHMFQALEEALRTAPVSSGGHSWRPDVDGRVFFILVSRFARSSHGDATIEDIIGSRTAEGVKAVIDSIPNKVFKARLQFDSKRLGTALKAWPCTPPATAMKPDDTPTLPLMPFDNPVFNSHISSIHLRVDDGFEASADNIPTSPRTASSSDSDSWDCGSPASSPLTSPTTDKFSSTAIFKDTQHWHNNKKILAPFQEKKAVLFGDTRDISGGTPKDGETFWSKRRREKWQQKFMASLHRHAATLTGAKGAQLQKIVIPATRRFVADVVSTEAGPSSAHPGTKDPAARKATSSTPGVGKKGAKQPKLSSADKLRAQIQVDKHAKTASESEIWWKQQLSRLDKLSAVDQKVSFLEQLSRNKRMTEGWLRVESTLYRAHLQLSSWIYDPDPEATQARYAVDILRSIHSIYDDHDLFDGAAKLVRLLLNTLGFSQLQLPTPNPAPKSRALSFKFIKFTSSKSTLYPFLLIKNPIDFQLEHYGIYMDRSMDGEPDPRVSFLPDAWQRELLDRVDRRESCLAVAPTSSGKTFISFYAMEQVLRESDDGVLVYVAPTKALVNQLAAEVAARFDKTSRSGSLWAAHTRDYRVNDPSRCQILVTVPEMLSIMLLSPVLAKIWIPKLRWIILDEIHCIGQQDGGSVWEQLVLLAPCPILGLSATIGNPREFNQWLGSVQEQHGYKHNLIEHKPRYSHLRKSIYRLSSSVPEFEGLSSTDAPQSRLTFIHPMSVLDSGITVLPEDLALESRDCLTLYRAMKNAAHGSPQKLSQLIALEPAVFFSETRTRLVAQKDVLRYEAALKAQLTQWMSEQDLQESVIPAIGKELAVSGLSGIEADGDCDPEVVFGNIICLLKDLHLRGELPAILFNFDRYGCEVIANTILEELTRAEQAWRPTSPEWAQRLVQWESWKEGAKSRERAAQKATKFKRDPDDPPSETLGVSSWEASFDPEDPSPHFSFAGVKSSYSKDEMDRDIEELRRVTPDWALAALKRGVAVHHQGMNRKYRTLVESLFRVGFLRVVVATGTLALGINMPVRSAVFVRDSPYLTPLTFRQCAGRAGRRGLDLLGRVVFYGIPLERVHRLLTSKISPLTGNMPLTTTLSLRLCNLLHGSGGAPSAVRAIKSIMELPQLSVASDIGRHELLHHLRFSIDYLRHNSLLDATGQPMIMFPIAAHLYHTEPSNLALIVLLQRGVLHRICASIDTNPYDTKRDLVALLSHLFARRSLPRIFAGADAVEKLRPPKCPSRILLPHLSRDAKDVLSEHNKQILGIFKGCVQTYAVQHLRGCGADDVLPLSNEKISGTPAGTDMPPYCMTDLRQHSISEDIVGVSMFAANSGVTDATIKSVGDLTRTTRAGLHLSKHAIPSMDCFVLPQELPLNGYILDFFNHGQVQALVDGNQVKRGDVWFALQDFSLALATLRTGLEHYFKSIAGAAEDDEPDLEDGTDSDSEDENEEIPVSSTLPSKPKGVDSGDWNVYRTVVATKQEFDEKWKKMWA